MKTLKSVLDGLPPQARQLLMYAFENERPEYVLVDGDEFIGVNLVGMPHLLVEEEAGVWARGRVKNRS